MVLLGTTRYYLVLLGTTRCYLVLLGTTWYYLVLLQTDARRGKPIDIEGTYAVLYMAVPGAGEPLMRVQKDLLENFRTQICAIRV